MLQNMNTADEEDVIASNTCANCGKEGSGDMIHATNASR